MLRIRRCEYFCNIVCYWCHCCWPSLIRILILAHRLLRFAACRYWCSTSIGSVSRDTENNKSMLFVYSSRIFSLLPFSFFNCKSSTMKCLDNAIKTFTYGFSFPPRPGWYTYHSLRAVIFFLGEFNWLQNKYNRECQQRRTQNSNNNSFFRSFFSLQEGKKDHRMKNPYENILLIRRTQEIFYFYWSCRLETQCDSRIHWINLNRYHLCYCFSCCCYCCRRRPRILRYFVVVAKVSVVCLLSNQWQNYQNMF